jgi:hypothetical protein
MDNPSMPDAIAAAIVKVMGAVRRLGKDETNRHGGYNYASVDKFYEAIGPLMADAGIIVIPFERSVSSSKRQTVDQQGRAKETSLLLIRYDLFIYHESGVGYGPIPREIQVIESGAQSYGSAQSFVDKYFLRMLFKVPTGEKDADADANLTFAPDMIDIETATEVSTILRDTGADVPAFLRFIGAKSIEEMTSAQYKKALPMLRAKEAVANKEAVAR